MTILCSVTGQRFDLENPDPQCIRIEDIAHGLSFICRGSGQVKDFYPVAQHCIYCAREAKERGYSPTVVLACLLHDASEAFMADVPKPIKDNLIPEYKQYEELFLSVVYQKFIGRALSQEESDLVDLVDHTLLQFDLKYLFGLDVKEPEIHIEIDSPFESFSKTEQMYLETFIECQKQLN